MSSQTEKTPNYRKPLVWIVHRLHTKNMGDKLLGIGLEACLNRHGCRTERLEYLGVRNGLVTRPLHKTLKKLKLRALSSRIGVLNYLPYALTKRPNLILIGGGQLLLPNDAFIPALEAWARLAKRCDAQLAVFSVGTEERDGTFPEALQSMLRNVLSQAIFVRLRDSHSQDIVERITGQRYPLAPDTAYGLPIPPNEHAHRTGIGVCPASFKSVNPYKRFNTRTDYYIEFTQHIDKFIHSGEGIVVFSTTWGDRREVGNMASELTARYPENPVKTVSITNPDDLISTLSGLRVIIGSRMHALILGQLVGTKTCTVARNEKLVAYDSEAALKPMEHLREFLNLEIQALLEITALKNTQTR